MLEYEACFFFLCFCLYSFCVHVVIVGYHLSGATSHLQVHWERWFDWFHLGLLWPQISPGTWGLFGSVATSPRTEPCLNFLTTNEASKQESKAYAEIALSMGIEPSEGHNFRLEFSENRGVFPHPILIGFSIIIHPFWGSPIFGNTRFGKILCGSCCGQVFWYP